MLVNSRRPIVPEGGRIVRLDMLPEPQAMALLRKGAPHGRGGGRRAGARVRAAAAAEMGSSNEEKIAGAKGVCEPDQGNQKSPPPVSIRVSLPVWLMVGSDRVKPSNRSPSLP